MKLNKSIIGLLFWCMAWTGSSASQPPSGVRLSLDSCRTLAIGNNKSLRMADSERRAAHYQSKAAQTNYLPRIAASGAYLHTSRELSLLSGEQKQIVSGLGDVGVGLVDALHTDTRNMGVLGVMLTQPIYMGGKIAAYNRITRFAEQAAARQQDLALQEVILEVDEAYWQIVELQSRRKLAESYLALVEKLDSDLQHMIAEGVATKADGLSVKVKVNEAQVAMIQVDNGLSIAQMLLCQICGLPLDTPIELYDSERPLASATASEGGVAADVQAAIMRRPELGALSLSARIYNEKVKLARAEFMPTVALTGGYMASNPSLFNSFERNLKGMWSVGVVVNVPLVTFGERAYKVKAAKANAATAALRLEETREKVELQVNQSRQKVDEAQSRLSAASRSQEEADENLRYATLGMQEGVIPVSNVLEAQTAWLKARSELLTAQIDLRLANLYLLKAVGSLDINQ